MWRWLRDLFGGGEVEATERAPPPRLRAAGPGDGRLKPLDVPTILARLRALGITEPLQESDRDRVERLVKQRCREGAELPWWGPLAEWAELAGRARDPSCRFVPVRLRPRIGRELVDDLLALEGPASGRRFALVDLVEASGGPPVADEPPPDGEYLLRYRADDRDDRLPVRVAGGRVELDALVGRLNALCRRFGWNERYLRLEPLHGDLAGVVFAGLEPARRAARLGWAALPGEDGAAAPGDETRA